MPEENENQMQSLHEEEPQPEPSQDGASEAKAHMVPVHELERLREELRAERTERAKAQDQLVQLASEFQRAGNKVDPQAAPREIDASIQNELMPYFQAMARPILEKVETLEKTNAQLNAERSQREAESYIQRNIPNLSEIEPQLVQFLETLPEEQKSAYRGNPAALVVLAKAMFPATKGKSKEAMRSMAKTETDTAKSGPSQPKDYSDMSTAEMQQHLRSIGWRL